MPIVIADRVKVTTTTTGTGTLTLGSAVTGFQDFGVIGDGNETYYTITDTLGNFEVGIGIFTASGTTLSRDTVLSSSNSGLAVDFGVGTKDVFVTYPSGRSVVSYDGNNSEFPTGTRMLFGQTTAPTGWTKDTTNFNNHALRVVTGTASTGGTVDFTTAFASQTPTGTVTVTANTGQIAQAGSISVSTGQVIQGGNVSSPASTGLVAQGGNVAVSTGQAAGSVTVSPATQGGNISVSTGQAAAPGSTGNAASPNGDTTLAVPTIPSHSHTGTRRSPLQNVPSGGNVQFTGSPFTTTGDTGGGGAHSHPAGNHTHPFTGGQHAHPASGTFTGSAHTHPASGGQHVHPAAGNFSGFQHSHPVSVTSTFSGVQHAHPASGTFTGSQHDHPVSAPASFSGSAINLAVKYLDVITATKN